jgi:hypothetical protein
VNISPFERSVLDPTKAVDVESGYRSERERERESVLENKTI